MFAGDEVDGGEQVRTGPFATGVSTLLEEKPTGEIIRIVVVGMGVLIKQFAVSAGHPLGAGMFVERGAGEMDISTERPGRLLRGIGGR